MHRETMGLKCFGVEAFQEKEITSTLNRQSIMACSHPRKEFLIPMMCFSNVGIKILVEHEEKV